MLDDILMSLKSNEAALKRRGVIHASVFGSFARGEQKNDSDIDILIDLDEGQKISIFDYAEIKDMISAMVDGRADIVTRGGLKQGLRERVEKEAIDAF